MKLGTLASLTAAVALCASCDSSATANGNQAVSQDRLSRQYESCAKTADCSDGLRCFQHICQSTAASQVGDYHAAAGAHALAQGDVQAAVEAYNSAINRYQSDDVPVPLTLRCARGHALVGAASDPAMAEQAALSLHRCFRQSPVGSALRARALADLAALGRAGLNPELLAPDKDAPKYMTKGPTKPPTDGLVIKATGDAKKPTASYTSFLAQLGSDQAKTALVSCWEANWKATKKKTLKVTIPFRNRFHEGEVEEDDRYKLTVEGTPPAAGTAQRCAYDAIVPIAEEFSKSQGRRGQRWDAKITVSIGQ